MLAESQMHPYHRLMVDHMTNVSKGAAWSFMGSGKTVSTLTALAGMDMLGQSRRPALILAPLRVARDVWPGEVAKWEHLRHLHISPMIGTETQRLAGLHREADIYTINYENLMWLIKTCGDRWPFGPIVIDEATRIKSLRASIRRNEHGTEWVQGKGGARAKGLLQTIYRFNTERIIELSGTPAPNGLLDLWGQIFPLDYGQRLGRVFEGYKERWFQSSFDGWGIEPLAHASKEIHEAVSDICMSLKAEDWFDLDTPIDTTVRVTLPPEARKKYKEMEKQFFAEVNGHQIQAFNAGAKTQKLLQFAAGAAYLGSPDDPGPRQWTVVHDEKLDALEEITEELAGAPAIVSYQFKSDLARIKKRFPYAVELDTKASTIEAWNKGRIKMLLAHPASAGHGLSLQYGGNVMIYFSVGWNAEEHQQIFERIGPVRQMQSGLNRVTYRYFIIAEGTLDEEVMDVQEGKFNVQDALLNAVRKRY